MTLEAAVAHPAALQDAPVVPAAPETSHLRFLCLQDRSVVPGAAVAASESVAGALQKRLAQRSVALQERSERSGAAAF